MSTATQLAEAQRLFEQAPSVHDVMHACPVYRPGLAEPWHLDRAQRAGREPRLEAIARLNPRDWRQRLSVLYAVTNGVAGDWLPELIDYCFYVPTMAEANRSIGPFLIADPALTYVEERLLEAIQLLTIQHKGHDPLKVLAGAAALSGLVAENRIMEYRSAGTVEQCGHVQRGTRVDLVDTLVSGSANMLASDMPSVLRHWSRLVLDGAEEEPLPEVLTRQTVDHWTARVLARSGAPAGPNDSYGRYEQVEEDVVMLRWFSGRLRSGHLVVHIGYEPDGSLEEPPLLHWYSGQAGPSTRLGIEALLVLPGCTGFGPGDYAAYRP